MIHIVTIANRRLYSDLLREMFQIRRRRSDHAGEGELWPLRGATADDGDDDRAVYLLHLGPSEELLGFVRLRPADDRSLQAAGLEGVATEGAWEAGWIWVSGELRDPCAAMLRLMAGCAEHVLACGGSHLLALVEISALPHLLDAALEFMIAAPPAAGASELLVGLRHELTADALVAMRESLGEPAPLTFSPDEEDVAIAGSLARVQREFDLARRSDAAAAAADAARPDESRKRIGLMFTRHDAGARRMRRPQPPGRRQDGGPRRR